MGPNDEGGGEVGIINMLFCGPFFHMEGSGVSHKKDINEEGERLSWC